MVFIFKLALFIAIWLIAGTFLVDGAANLSANIGWQIYVAVAFGAVALSLSLVVAEHGFFDSGTLGLAAPLVIGLTLWGILAPPAADISSLPVSASYGPPALPSPPVTPADAGSRPAGSNHNGTPLVDPLEQPRLASTSTSVAPSVSQRLTPLQGLCTLDTDKQRWCQPFFFEHYAGNVEDLKLQLAHEPMQVPSPWPVDACPTFGQLKSKVQYKVATNMRASETECGLVTPAGSKRAVLGCRQWFSYDCIIPGERSAPTRAENN